MCIGRDIRNYTKEFKSFSTLKALEISNDAADVNFFHIYMNISTIKFCVFHTLFFLPSLPHLLFTRSMSSTSGFALLLVLYFLVWFSL